MAQRKHKPEESVGQAASGRRPVSQGRRFGGDPRDQRDAVHVLPLAQGVRRAEVGPGEAAEGPREGERAAAKGGLRSDAGEADPARGRLGKLLSPARRRRCIDHVMTKFDVSERLACRVLGQHRSTQRKAPKGRADDAALTPPTQSSELAVCAP